MKASDRLLNLDRLLEVGRDINGKVYVSYKDGYVKDYPCLIGAAGSGKTFEEACEDYLMQISGKTLVFNPSDKERRKEVIVL